MKLSETLSPKTLEIIFKVRAPIVRALKPLGAYYLFSKPAQKNTQPLSRKFGFDRGTPITRYYIEQFLQSQQKYIKGYCLEIHDATYIKRFGKNKVTRVDVLDIDTQNKNATIIGDLRHLNRVKSNTYDCLVITQTFGMIDDYGAALRECHRILKKGGVLIGTAASMGPMHNPNESYWRFTKASITYILKKYFLAKNVFVKTFGNSLSGQASWVGVAVEELTKNELGYTDPHFQVIVGFRAKK